MISVGVIVSIEGRERVLAFKSPRFATNIRCDAKVSRIAKSHSLQTDETNLHRNINKVRCITLAMKKKYQHINATHKTPKPWHS